MLRGLILLALAQPQPKPSQPPAFPVQTALVHVDALVTDKDGRQVTDLVAEDFEVESDGTRYPVRYSEYFRVTEPLPAGTKLALPGGKPRQQDVRRIVVFVVANPLMDVYVRPNFESTGRQLAVPPETTPMAVTMEAAHRTADVLESYVSKYVGPRDLAAIFGTEDRQGGLARFTVDRERLRSLVRDARTRWSDQRPVDFVTPMDARDRGAGDTELVSTNLGIVETLERAVQTIAPLPGRKLIFLVAPGLRTQGESFEAVRNAIDKLTDEANRNGVTIYGVAPLGAGRRGSRTAGLDSISLATGGRTLWSGDLEGGVGTVLAENSGYYLLGYDPGGSAQAPRRIKVRVARAGLNVTTRRTALAERPRDASAAPSAAETSLATLLDSPFAGGALEVRLRPYFRWDEQKPHLANVVDIGPAGLDLQTSDGTSSVRLEAQLRVTDPRGEVVLHQMKQLIAQARPGGSVRFVLDTELREDASHVADVAIRDARSQQAGSATGLIERPSAVKNQLRLASLMLHDSAAAGGPPADRFPPDTTVAVSSQVANARVDRKSGEIRIEVQARVRSGGVLVASTRPQILTRAASWPFGVNGRIPLTGLAPGPYVAELVVVDLGAKRSEVVVSAPFEIVNRP